MRRSRGERESGNVAIATWWLRKILRVFSASVSAMIHILLQIYARVPAENGGDSGSPKNRVAGWP